MARHKWNIVKYAVLSLPFLMLAAYLVDLPFLVPRDMLPERRYLAVAASAGAEGLKAARGNAREAFAVTENGLVALPPGSAPDSAFQPAASLLPDRSLIGPVVSDLAKGLPRMRKLRLVSTDALCAEEIASLAAEARNQGLPLDLDIPGAYGKAPGPRASHAMNNDFPVLSISSRLRPKEDRITFELLFAPEATRAGLIRVAASDRGTELWHGSGLDLPKDLVLRLEASKKDLSAGVTVSLQDDREGTRTTVYDLATEMDEAPQVLVISERRGQTSWIEEVYPSRRTTPEGAAELDLHAYELVVLDGFPLARIRGKLLNKLLEVSKRGTGSILFVADSPDFGKKGEKPELEALLPVSLLPKSLKELPDLALLVLIDTSGSMFGDKLSLAKVTGLELLRELKPTDRVGMLLFSDERQWVYDFAPNASIVAAPVIDPVPATGGTDLATALSAGLDRLARVPLQEKHAVIVSDGVTRPADFGVLAARARREGVTISTMGVGTDLNRALLEELAIGTGGRFYRVSGPEEVPSLLFEDRKNEARPPFIQARTPVLALNGEEVATVDGMSLYSAASGATVVLTDAVGDPLLASMERMNRAVLLFASDLHGTYTSGFFSKPLAAGIFKDRLDALFSERPLEVSLLEGRRGVHIGLRSDSLVRPSLLLSAPGHASIEAEFVRRGQGDWDARIVPPARGRYTASIIDRGSGAASFSIASNDGLSGLETADVDAAASYRAMASGRFGCRTAWLLLFFLSSVATTLVLRTER